MKIKNAPANYSLIENISINIFRNNNFKSMQIPMKKCANNVVFIMSVLKQTSLGVS